MFPLCSATILGWDSRRKVRAWRAKNLMLGSVSLSMSLSLSTACRTIFSWLVIPATIVRMHSYSRDLALVVSKISPRGPTSFFASLGSSGVSTPNTLTSLIVIQLLEEVVRSL